MNLDQLIVDLEEIKSTIREDPIQAESLLGFIIGEINTAAQQSVERTCFYCDEDKEPAKETICQDCVDLLSDASR